MKIIFFVFFTLLISTLGFSRDKFQFDKLSCKIGYQSYPWMGDDGVALLGRRTPIGYFDMYYNLTKAVKVGARLGYGKYKWIDLNNIASEKIEEGVIIVPLNKPIIVYGVNLDLSLLPLIVKRDISIVDLYITSHFGGIYLQNNNHHLDNKRPDLDYGIYGGITLYPWRNVGVYYEYGFGNCVKWRTGLSFRF